MSVADFLLLEQLSDTYPGEPWNLTPKEAEHGHRRSQEASYRERIKAAYKAHPLQEPAKGFRSAIEVMGLAEAESELREAINDGIKPSQLAQLVARLATLTHHSAGTIEKLAATIRREEDSVNRIEAEAQAIATQADRRQLAELLTPGFLLPTPIAQAIEARSRYLPTDGPSAVLPFLSAIAGLVPLGTEVVGSRVANLRVPVNLYSCLVARSGAKKSPIGRQLMTMPIAALVGEQEAANQAAWEAWREACEQAKGEKKPVPSEPVPLRLVVSEYSGEALNVQLQALEKAGQGLLIHRDELAGLFGTLNQYRGGKGGDEQQLLELYDGAGLTSLRVAGQRSYGRAQVSIYGTTQPDVLRELVADGDASGLWARFIFVPLPERVVPLALKTTAAEVAEVESAAQMLADVCRTVRGMTAASFHLTDAATERFAMFEARRQEEALRATISAQSALFGKSAGKVLRLAGLLHLLRLAAMEADKDAPIEAELIDKAAALVEHLDGWALSMHAEVSQGPATGLMRLVHRVAEEAQGPISWKQVWHRMSKAQRQESDAAAGATAMEALASGGYGEIETGKRGALSYRALRALP
ncbi:MAG: DUF3987 domain-containing protein [Synechococcaceae cyanobacterium]|nr:DUF3987 domain-containing protein [Synechococcaceae cyanobacterium]